MKTEEEIESWYEDEKKKALETLISAKEKKENPEKAELEYKAALNKLFVKYSKLRLKVLNKATAKARREAAEKAKPKSSLPSPEGANSFLSPIRLLRLVSQAINKVLKIKIRR